MQFFLFLLVLKLTLVICNQKDVVAQNLEAPWHVSIQTSNGKHLCSGAIISDIFIVTTAKCVRVGDVSKYNLVVGSNDLKYNHPHNIYHIEYIIIHPHYNKPKKANDIALIHTTTNIKFSSKVKLIKYKVDYLLENTQVSLTGFGWRRTFSPKDRLKMRKIKLQIISHDQCLKAYSEMVLNPIDIGHLCLTGPTDKDYCNEESGGPVVYKQMLVGLTSFGPGCANGQPYVATRISFYFDFIRTTTLGCSRCLKHNGFIARFFPL